MRWRSWFAAALAAAVGALIVWDVAPLKPFQDCIHARKNDQAYNALHADGSLIIQERARIRLHIACSVHVADVYQNAIVALSGIVVAFFTFTLWWVTRKSVAAAELAAEAANRSAKTAESALLDLERGYLYVVDWKSDVGSFLDTVTVRMQPAVPKISVIAVNHGRTACTIVQGSMSLSFLSDEPSVSVGQSIQGDKVAPASSFAYVVVGPAKPHQFPQFEAEANDVDRDEFIAGRLGLFCYGWIEYVDIFRNYHPVVFCRRYVIETAMWEPVGGSAKNYSG